MIASRYEILACLGAGGMGIVFKARDRVLGETVALKAARLSRPFDLRALERFRSEVRLARKVRHPNVCVVHDYGEDGDAVFLSMEYIDGRNLKDLLREGRALPWEEAYAIVLQVADGLVAIHEAGIVHRDLKPGNVMVDGRGVVRVVDFGIARWADGPQSTSVAGAADYMAPEQIRGGPLDGRTDVYCFGCLIYETFSGWPLFSASSPVGAMLKHLEEPPPLEGVGGARLPRSLVPVLARALAKEPSDRYSSSQEMREALHRARSSLAGDTTDFVTSGPPARPRAARASPTWLLGLAGAALAGAIAWTTLLSLGPVLPPSPPSTATPSPVTIQLPLPTTVAVRRMPKTPPATTTTSLPSPSLPPPSGAATVEPEDTLPPAPSPYTTTTTTLASAPRKAGDLVDANERGVVLPVCESCPKPRTPLIAEHPIVRSRLQGKQFIVLLVLVDEKGRVAEVKPQGEVEFLGEAAVGAVRKWRYRPATKDGVPVKVWIGVGIRFELPDEAAPDQAKPPSS